MRISLGLSGGVDSSVAALLLQRQGHQVSAIFMKNWEEDESLCPARQDYLDAKEVAASLDIPLQAVSFADQYWDLVFTPFLAEYEAGCTPNPDLACNREIKFSAFLDYALSRGAERIATGHYARVYNRDGLWRLAKGVDSSKDQSYFLASLSQHQLAHSLFPLGELTKTQVRDLAAGLNTQHKKSSTGICFIGERPFREFLGRYLPPAPGMIITPEGDKVGTHAGLHYYTLGQRQGLGIGGRSGDQREDPWYVLAKDPAANALIVDRNRDHPLLYSKTLVADSLSWIAGFPPALPWRGQAKIRYRQEDQDCSIFKTESEAQLRIEFAAPQRAATPGQAIVFYEDQECLGCGIIKDDRERR